MLHIPSMLTYGFLSFILAFFNKALFEIAQFHCNLFMIFIQLIFILLSFHILSYLRLITLPTLNKTDLYTLLIPSTFYCLSTVLSLQTLMTLNVTIYVVIKVNRTTTTKNESYLSIDFPSVVHRRLLFFYQLWYYADKN